jgi:SAM-dependent methyltransferase
VDVWAVARLYDRYMGDWSRPVAARFVDWLDPGEGLRWLEVGCGTGALTEAVAARRPALLVGFDRSPAFAHHTGASRAGPGRGFGVADAQALPLAGASVDVVVSGLVLNFVPDPGCGLAEMARVARPGGTVAGYVWDYADGMRLLCHLWTAAVALDPAAAAHDEATRFPLCRPEPLAELWRGAGLRDVLVEPVEVARALPTVDDVWAPFLGGQGPAPAYVTSLPEERRAALRDRFAAELPVAPDGSVTLTARAWAVRGRR